MSPKISSRFESIDTALCCIPAVSTVTNMVHLLAMVIMKALEKCFAVQIFEGDYKEFLESRRSMMYVSLIPLIGNLVVCAVLLSELDAGDDEEIEIDSFAFHPPIQLLARIPNSTLNRVGLAFESISRRIQNTKNAKFVIRQVVEQFSCFLEILYSEDLLNSIVDLKTTYGFKANIEEKSFENVNKAIEEFYRAAMNKLGKESILSDNVTPDLENYRPHWEALLKELDDAAR